jgi:signal transduction histidine kinase
MNYYQLIPILAVIANVFTAAYIIAKNPRSTVNRAYLLWNGSALLWLFCEIILWTRISGETAVLMGKLSTIGWILFGFLFVNFIYSVTNRKEGVLYYFFFLISVLFLGLSLSTNLVISGSILYYWGNNVVPGPLYLPAIFFTLVLPITYSIFVLVSSIRKGAQNKRTLFYIGLGGSFMMISGFATDVLIPEIIGVKSFISLAPNLTVVMNFFIFLGIYRHGILIDVDTIAHDLLDNVTDGMIIINDKGELKLVNQSAKNMFGKELIKGVTLGNLIKNFRSGFLYEEFETILTKSKLKVSLSQSNILQWGSLSGHLVIIRDLSRRNKLESEMVKIQKLESVGVLAGGIAHDFNNVLTSILGSISLSKSMVGKDHEAWKVLTEAEEATIKSKHLTRQLVTFAKGGNPVKKPISIVSLIKNAVHFSLSGSNVNYTFAYPENLLSVLGDEGQIRQVVSNLVINAKESMSSGGILEIEAGNRTVTVKDDDLEVGEYIFVLFKDHGSGIIPENLTKIFDPYFTTKKRGTGLGLFSSYSIIKKHGGSIEVSSDIGTGTTFTIMLPCAKEKAIVKKHSTLMPLVRSGKILFMDDEELIFLTTGKLLSNTGYDMVYAENGLEALEKYFNAMKHGEPFDLVIMDLTVQGGMGGEECIKKLVLMDSNVTAIISSGYSDNPVMANYKDYGFKGVIVKPYKYSQLIFLMDKVLEESE